MKDTSMMVLDDPFPFGVAPDSDITEKEVAETRKQMALAQLQEAFSGKWFTICPLEWPDKYSDDSPAAQLISAMHCREFDKMSDGMKILLYRACLQVYRPEGITGKDFPYPALADMIAEKSPVDTSDYAAFAALTVAEKSPVDTSDYAAVPRLHSALRAPKDVKLAGLIAGLVFTGMAMGLVAATVLGNTADHQQIAYPPSGVPMRVPAPPRAIPYGESVPPPHITGPVTAPTLKEETQ